MEIKEQARVKIDDEFKNLLPPQTKDESQALEDSILANGVLEPIILWKDHENNLIILIDGHHRLSIALKHKIQYKTKFLDFKDRTDVIEWIMSNQNARRNINRATRQYMIGKKYNIQASKTEKSKNFDNKSTGSTAKKIAAQFGISESTAKNYAEYAKIIDGFNSDYIKNDLILKFDETRIEILKEIQSELYRKKINENNFLYFVAEIETKIKNQKQETEIYKPKPKITENKIFEKTSPKPNAPKGQNLTFGENKEKTSQITNSNLQNVKTYTELDLQDLKIQIEYYKELAESRVEEIQSINKKLQDSEKIIEHLREQKPTGLKTWDRMKLQKKDVVLLKRENESILKFSKDLNWVLVSTHESQNQAKKQIEKLLIDEDTICEQY